MKWIVLLMMLVIVPTAFGQTVPEIVITDADIEIRFSTSANPVWINGDDPAQTAFTVGPISYSSEPLSTAVTHTTKLNEPEIWEVELWGFTGDPFRKAVFVITVYEAPARIFELRTRNRYAGDTMTSPWNISDADKVIGKTEKPIHRK